MTEERDETTPEPAAEAPERAQEPRDEAAGPGRSRSEEAAGPAASQTAASSKGEPSGPESGPGPGGALAEALPLLEALLFASSRPVSVEKLAEAAELPEALVEQALAALEGACAAEGRGVRLDRVAGGVRLATRPEYDYPVRRLLGLDGKTKLSMAALETLAIVSYRQPVTGPEIAELRGVNSSSSLRTLLDRKLITTAGRKEVVGTPFLYRTTKEFLVHFGLKGLGDLPKPEELEAIYGLEAPRPDPAQTELFHLDEATGELEEPDGSGAGAAPATDAGSAIGAGDGGGSENDDTRSPEEVRDGE